MSLTGERVEGGDGARASALKCPMPECRRPLESAFFSTTAMRTSEPCLHFVAAWGDPSGMVEAVMHGLAGEREFVIRNVRLADVEVRRRLAMADPAALERAIRERLQVVEAGTTAAAFGDRHERAGAARDVAQIIGGPDPILGGGSLR